MPLASAFDLLGNAGPHLVYLGILGLLLASAVGVPFPEDLTLLSAGYLISLGVAEPLPAAVAGILGVVAGDFFVFSLGRRFGPRILNHPWIRRAGIAARTERARGQFDRFGAGIVFGARFVSTLRGPVYLTAGFLRMPRRRFLIWDLGGAFLQVPVLLLAGRHFGPRLEAVHPALVRILFLAVLAISASVFFIRAFAARRSGSRDSTPGE